MDSPRARLRITRLVRNAWPGTRVELVEGLQRGLGFRILDEVAVPDLE